MKHSFEELQQLAKNASSDLPKGMYIEISKAWRGGHREAFRVFLCGINARHLQAGCPFSNPSMLQITIEPEWDFSIPEEIEKAVKCGKNWYKGN